MNEEITMDNIIRLFQHEFHCILSKFRVEIIDIRADLIAPALLTTSSCCILHDGTKPLFVCKGLQTIYRIMNQHNEGSPEHELANQINDHKEISVIVFYTQQASDDHWVDALTSFMMQRLLGDVKEL